MLIYFIHHVSVSLQAPRVVAAVRADLERVIARVAGGQDGSGEAVDPARGDGLPPAFDAGARPVAATGEGYLQAVDYDGLMAAARADDLVLRLEYRPGDYVIEGCPLAGRVARRDRCDAALAERLNGMFHFGSDGTPEQDVEYALRQMVEVAVRALSPGINDPFTAINCVDALGSAVCRIARLGLPGPLRHDRGRPAAAGRAGHDVRRRRDTAFNQIRQYGRESVAVTIRLLEVLRACAAAGDERRPAAGAAAARGDGLRRQRRGDPAAAGPGGRAAAVGAGGRGRLATPACGRATGRRQPRRCSGRSRPPLGERSISAANLTWPLRPVDASTLPPLLRSVMPAARSGSRARLASA